MPLEEIDAMRTRPGVLIPHREMNRSASELIEIPAELGPYAGQILIPDNNGTRITRVMSDKVNGEYQGACTHFIKNANVLSGGDRVAFTADGKTLYTGHTVRGWGKVAEGLQRITWPGKTPFDVKTIKLESSGFMLNYTRPTAEVDLKKCSVRSFKYVTN